MREITLKFFRYWLRIIYPCQRHTKNGVPFVLNHSCKGGSINKKIAVNSYIDAK